MTKKIEQLFDKMWSDYLKTTPLAGRVHSLLTGRGEDVINDHVALRTFDHPKVCVDVLAKPFLKNGYQQKGEYHFEQKKLKAKHYEHLTNPLLPKVFISELQLAHFSEKFNHKVNELVGQLNENDILKDDFTCSGRPWSISYKDYLELKNESDYGAWLAAIGYRPNHFTVSVNHLKNFKDLSELNKFLKENGFKLNDSGGEIKGSEKVLLEQSSTLADQISVRFSDGEYTVSSCYYEFAKRYPLADGSLYQGFIATSADKIFESTDRSQ